jgi:hypothetical protein
MTQQQHVVGGGRGIFRRKPVGGPALDVEHEGLERTLGLWQLTAIGLGAIIGAGIFSLAGAVANETAGPAVTVSFLIAGVASAAAAFSYAEFAGLIPQAGSAYTYGYAVLGELAGWFIGWDLLLEYTAIVAVVAIGISGYFSFVLEQFGVDLPTWMLGAPGTGEGHRVDLFAMLLCLLIAYLLNLGIRTSARIETVLVFLKVAIVLAVIAVGAFYVSADNLTPYFPFGVGGAITGAATVFFAVFGYDAMSTAAEESKDSERNLPKAILLSLAISMVLYLDWVRSTNLGDHDTRRISAFAEWRYAPAASTQLDTAVRVDRYTEFGTAWSPSLGVGWWPIDAVRVRASGARAFRVPTFTERYYSDPANFARPEVHAETAWAEEAGVDLFPVDGWIASATVFSRQDHDVIDWLRPTTAERWRTYNIRDVDTIGTEFSLKRAWSNGSFVQGGYTYLDVSADAVTQLSKYVLDYAPHSVIGAASIGIPGGLRVAPRLEIKQRTRSTGTTEYVVADLRLSREYSGFEIGVEGSNLGSASYQEVLGVQMPGRAVILTVAFRR